MSSIFVVHCDTDDEDGPELKRQPGGVSILDNAAWSHWLIDHEHHEMTLRWKS